MRKENAPLRSYLLRGSLPHLLFPILCAWGDRLAIEEDVRVLTFSFILLAPFLICWFGTWLCLGGSPGLDRPDLKFRRILTPPGRIHPVLWFFLVVIFGGHALLFFLVYLAKFAIYADVWWGSWILVFCLIDAGLLVLCLFLGVWRDNFDRRIRPRIERRLALESLTDYYEEHADILSSEVSRTWLQSWIRSEIHDGKSTLEAWRIARDKISDLQSIVRRRTEEIAAERRGAEERRARESEARRREERERAARESRIRELDEKVETLRRRIEQASNQPDPDLREIAILEHEVALKQLLDEREILLSSSEGGGHESVHTW